MRIEEETIIIKDGRSLTLRSAEEKDAETMLDYIRKTAEETHFLIRYPEEISDDLEREKKIITDNLESEDSVWLTVFDKEKAIGNCSISRHRNHIKLRHLIEVRGSLLYGLFDSKENLIGISLGKVKHWCGGTEYFIEEFCIRNEYQKKGCGKAFMEMIGESIKKRGLNTIYRMTDRNQPAYGFYKKMGFQELPELTTFVKEI